MTFEPLMPGHSRSLTPLRVDDKPVLSAAKAELRPPSKLGAEVELVCNEIGSRFEVVVLAVVLLELLGVPF